MRFSHASRQDPSLHAVPTHVAPNESRPKPTMLGPVGLQDKAVSPPRRVGSRIVSQGGQARTVTGPAAGDVRARPAVGLENCPARGPGHAEDTEGELRLPQFALRVPSSADRPPGAWQP